MAWLLGSLLTPLALAIPSQYSVSQLYHTQWTARDGAPTGIEDMVQTRDGFLWLATSSGLYRFDGVEFEQIREVGGVPLLSNSGFALYATANGGLWIGYGYGGVSYLHNGQLINYGTEAGLPKASVFTLTETPDGTAWAGTTFGLFRREGSQWKAVGADWNLPAGGLEQVLVDRDRTLWTAGGGKIFFLREGARKFEQVPVDPEYIITYSAVLDPTGRAVYTTYERFGLITLQATTGPAPYAETWDDRRRIPSSGAFVFDREGHFWVATKEGIGRFRLPQETTGSAEGDLRRFRADLAPLASGYVTALIEDFEGNIWVAGSGGLDRFRAPALLKRPLDPGADQYVMAMAPAPGEGVWATTLEGDVYRLGQGARERFKLEELRGLGIEALHVTPTGDVWLGAGDAIWNLRPGGRWQPSIRLGAARGANLSSNFNVKAMTQDRQGGMWVSIRSMGVYRVTGQEWSLWGTHADMPSKDVNVLALLTDDSGRVWFGFSEGEVAVLDGNRFKRFDAGKQERGAITAFAQQGSSMWVGSERGLWRVDGTNLTPVTAAGGSFGDVRTLVVPADGSLWAGTSEGIIHISPGELRRGLEDSRHGLRYERFNYLDGLPAPVRSAVGSDGKVWFATMNGVLWTDPARIPRNTLVPAVIVKSLVADGVSHAIGGDSPTRLPANPRNLQIKYTATSLTIPERVLFRYRLDGLDTDWQDVGTRREAYFTDLAPGSYRFRVIASNNDGVWNETGASFEFVIPPTFMQSRWFTALWVTAVAVALWFLYLFRLRAVKAHLRLRLEERMVERERIARELHDTFLQGVQGLMLRFQSAMERIPAGEPSRTLMEDALDRADRVISDGREAVTNLRASTGTSSDLADDLRVVGECMSKEAGVAFSLSVEGPARELDPVVRQDVQRLVNEALTNAFRHSRGTEVEVTLAVSRKNLTARVTDNGRGFDPAQAYDGHWGLVGMRERANRMHASLRIDSGATGTTVTLEVPARVAFNRSRKNAS